MITVTLMAVSPPSSKPKPDRAEPGPSTGSPPTPPEVGGLLARPPVDGGPASLEDLELELARELVR